MHGQPSSPQHFKVQSTTFQLIKQKQNESLSETAVVEVKVNHGYDGEPDQNDLKPVYKEKVNVGEDMQRSS